MFKLFILYTVFVSGDSSWKAIVVTYLNLAVFPVYLRDLQTFSFRHTSWGPRGLDDALSCLL